MATEVRQIRLRRDTTARWTQNNPLIGPGEIAIDLDLRQGRIGMTGNERYLDLPVAFGRAVGLTDVIEFGAVGDGVADDTAALTTAFQSGRPLYLGNRSYRVTSTVTVTATRAIHAVGYGAVITLDASVTAKQRVVSIDPNGYGLHLQGIVVDGSNKAFTGLYVQTTSSNAANVSMRDVSVRNVYRASTAFTGGDGIWIAGKFTSVFLERPDVRNVVMAAGAGVSGSQGVCGITVKASGPGLSPTEVTILSAFVENVYCEDTTYLMDQDGVRIFTEEDDGSSQQLYDTHFAIIGGTFKNCHGRSIKSQAEKGVIIGAQFIRDSTMQAAVLGVGAMPEIDFQVGGGMIAHTEHRYRSAVPARIIQASGTRQVGGKYNSGIQIDGIRVSRNGSGTARPTSFMSITMFEQLEYVADITNVQYIDRGNAIDGNFLNVTGTYTNSETHINMTNVSAPLNAGAYALYRAGTVASPLWGSITNFRNMRPLASGSNATLSGTQTAGSLTVVASGQNIRVA